MYKNKNLVHVNKLYLFYIAAEITGNAKVQYTVQSIPH